MNQDGGFAPSYDGEFRAGFAAAAKFRGSASYRWSVHFLTAGRVLDSNFILARAARCSFSSMVIYGTHGWGFL